MYWILAGGAADGVLLRAEDLGLAGEQFVAHQLLLDVVKAQAGDGVGEALTGDALIAEQQQRLLAFADGLGSDL